MPCIRNVLLFLALCGILIAGDYSRIEELEKELKTAAPGEKIDILINLAHECRRHFPGKAVEYGKEALQLAWETGNKNAEATALKRIGVAYVYQNKFNMGMQYYKRSLPIFKTLGDSRQSAQLERWIGAIYSIFGEYETSLLHYDKSLAYHTGSRKTKEVASLLQSKAIVYYYLGQLDNSLRYYLEALEIVEELGNDKYSETTCNSNLGYHYMELGDYRKSMYYNRRGLELAKELEIPRLISNALLNIAELHYRQENYKVAMEYCQKSLRVLETIDNPWQVANALRVQGNIYSCQKKYREALTSYRGGLKLCETSGDRMGIAQALASLGCAYKEIGEYSKALSALNRSLALAMQIKLKEILRQDYLYLSRLFSAMGDERLSLFYYKRYADTREQLYSKNTGVRISRIRESYVAGKMEEEIREIKSQGKKVLLISLFIFIMVTAAAAVFLVRYRSTKKQARQIMEEKEREIFSLKARKRYEKSSLTRHQEYLYLEKLLEYMKQEKPYLDSELTIGALASALSIPDRELSQVINEKINKHFCDFVNQYRVEEAKKLLEKSLSRRKMSILGIAFDVGFNSKSSFNTVFKRNTGLTPSQYRKMLQYYMSVN